MAWQRGGETYRDGTFEELRYDALGRRVLARARRDAGVLCGVTCASYVERTIWDGDQLLFEQRIPGGDALTSGALDFGTGSPPHYGRVGYVHALGLDEPLGTTGSAPRVVNVNWRGLGESSVTAAGAAADCSVSSGGACTTIPWPAGRGIYYGPVGNETSAPPTPTFAGTLLLNGEGSSGLLYRRHRFFDPATGQFTQEDPIGLGGGVNVYSFAGGDPVNFSDPFGLCPVCDIADIGFFLHSAYKAWKEPNRENLKDLGLDGVGLLPIIPSVGMVRRMGDAADVARRVSNRVPGSSRQFGRKFGEHLDANTPGYRTHNEYRALADDIFNDPNAVRTRIPSDAPLYRGETHIRRGSDLLRLDPQGDFRSLYRDPK